MSLESELSARLSGVAGLTALVSDRIFNTVLPQGKSLPAVVFQRVSTTRVSAFGIDTGDVQARVQVDIYAARGEQGKAAAVAAQVRSSLQRHSSGNIQDIMIEDESHDYIDDAEIWRVSFDLMIWFKE